MPYDCLRMSGPIAFLAIVARARYAYCRIGITEQREYRRYEQDRAAQTIQAADSFLTSQ